MCWRDAEACGTSSDVSLGWPESVCRVLVLEGTVVLSSLGLSRYGRCRRVSSHRPHGEGSSRWCRARTARSAAAAIGCLGNACVWMRVSRFGRQAELRMAGIAIGVGVDAGADKQSYARLANTHPQPRAR